MFYQYIIIMHKYIYIQTNRMYDIRRLPKAFPRSTGFFNLKVSQSTEWEEIKTRNRFIASGFILFIQLQPSFHALIDADLLQSSEPA